MSVQNRATHNGKGEGSSNLMDKRSPKLDMESGAASKVNKAPTFKAASHIGSVPDDWPMYSAQAADYVLGPTVGFGASSVVYQASFTPLNGRACAVKVIDLEAFGNDLGELRRETQLMSLSKHPNVLRVRGCWVDGSKLCIATRLMSSGSILDIMRFSFPEGFEEVIIATVLKQALEGLRYLHVNNWLHRDLKAANMLVDDDGTVLLGDFGVGVFLGETSRPSASNGEKKADSWNESRRKSFVGTPCWMAPEVVERKGYGVKADIWSFGITALEMSSGRAPHSRLAPVKVLMKTLKEEPPVLDRTGNAHKYSKLFDDFIRQCLQKDPTKRPSAEKLLQHAFFKQAKSKKFLVSNILSSLPPLSERQDRRRALSIASLQNSSSWDFSFSTSSKLNTPGSERNDPFVNFSASFPNSSSPNGSVRSHRDRMISIDSQYALAQKGGGDGLAKAQAKRLFELNPRSSRPTSADFGSGLPVSDSWNRKHRQRQSSVSFDLSDDICNIDESISNSDNVNLPVIEESKGDASLEGPNITENRMSVERVETVIPSLTDSNTSGSKVSSDAATTSVERTKSLERSSIDSPAAVKELGGALGRLFRRI